MSLRLLWLPQVLRDAGLTAHTYSGWQTRGNETWGPLRGVICHATGGSRTSTDAGEMRVLWETGSTSAPVPISQLYLSRSGTWTVGASGRCNHVLTGDKGPHRGFGNSALIGVEAQNDNRGEPWTATMLDSYQRGVAAICRHMGWPASVVVAHREHQSGKSDPLGVDMDAFRRRVAALLEEDTVALTTEDLDRIYATIWRRDGIPAPDVPSAATNPTWQAASYLSSIRNGAWRAVAQVEELAAGQAAILAAVAGEDVAAAVRAELDTHRAALLAELGRVLVPAVLAGLREQLGEVADERLVAAAEAGVRAALGGLDQV
jgi:hypothetical protein